VSEDGRSCELMEVKSAVSFDQPMAKISLFYVAMTEDLASAMCGTEL
jgi:hypothetical protein